MGRASAARPPGRLRPALRVRLVATRSGGRARLQPVESQSVAPGTAAHRATRTCPHRSVANEITGCPAPRFAGHPPPKPTSPTGPQERSRKKENDMTTKTHVMHIDTIDRQKKYVDRLRKSGHGL